MCHTYFIPIKMKFLWNTFVSFKFFFIKCRNIFPPGDSDFVDLTLMHFIFFWPKRTYQSCKPNQYLDRSGYFLKNDTKWHTNIFRCKIFRLQSLSPLSLKKISRQNKIQIIYVQRILPMMCWDPMFIFRFYHL